MKINNNISAVVSNKHLLRNEGHLSVHMEKLSSGFKINHAGDDPSGMAISNKMRAQIRGLNRASQNASDGMSVLETADGALAEVTSMIQRMRELSVQAANGTNSDSDRVAIQNEVTALTNEVQRVSDTTEFNTKKLLDGSLDNRVYTDGISRVYISNDVPAGNYKLTISEMPTNATLKTEKSWDELASFLNSEAAKGEDHFIDINGTSIQLLPGFSGEDYYTFVRKTAELGEASISDYSDLSTGIVNKVSFDSIGFGAEASLDIQMSSGLKEFFGLDWNDELNVDANKSYVRTVPGENAVLKLDKKNSDFGYQATFSTVTKESSVSASRSVDGRRIKITDVGGFEMDFLIDDDYVEEYNNKLTTIVKEVETTIDENGDPITTEVYMTVGEARLERASLRNEKSDILKERSSLNETRADLKSSIASLEKEIADLDEKINQTTDPEEASYLSKQKSEKESELDAANKSLSETQAWIDLIEEAETKSSDESISYEEAIADLKSAAEADLDTLAAEIEALEAKEEDGSITEEERNTLADDRAKLEDLNDRLFALNKESRLYDIDDEISAIDAEIDAAEKMPVEMEITDVGPMNLQIGANEGQQMKVRIDSMGAKALYLDQVSVLSERGATRALEQLDEALSRVTSTLANIGAYTNRLEHATASLDQTSENMEQAISRIKDADVAEEMTEYTKYNVLQQAATSALSQANELPQTALQLLQ